MREPGTQTNRYPRRAVRTAVGAVAAVMISLLLLPSSALLAPSLALPEPGTTPSESRAHSALLAPSDAPALGAYTRQERFGVAFLTHVEVPGSERRLVQSISEYSVAPLGIGWYSDWYHRATPDMPADGDIEYAQLLRVRDQNWPPDWSTITNVANLQQGALWMIGNEPECRNQDAITPTLYAERYHDAYQFITGQDPTARVAMGAMVEWTPLRELWLDRVLATYKARYGQDMPVHTWNIHIQILPEGAEGDPTAGAGYPLFDEANPVPDGIEAQQYSLADNANVQIFKSMVMGFRDWMKRNGQQDKELVISEMGVLFPSDYLADSEQAGDLRIEQFMTETFDWMLTAKSEELGCPSDDNRLVQRWLWYSLNSSAFWQGQVYRGFNGSLYDYVTKKPTRFGHRWIALQYQEGQTERVAVPLVANIVAGPKSAVTD